MPESLATSPQQSAAALLAGVRELPPLPDTATAIVTSLTDEFVTLETVAKIIEKDPALTARLLGLANSAFYSQKQEVATVRDAIIRVLGLDLTRGIALGIALGSAFKVGNCPAFDVGQFWRSSFYAAAVNACLSDSIAEMSPIEKQLAFVAGLTAELGLLALAVVDPDATQVALAGDSEQSLSDRLAAQFGFDHHAAGFALGEAWALPEPLIYVLGHVSDSTYAGSFAPLVRATGFSRRVADQLIAGEAEAGNLEDTAARLGVTAALGTILSGEAKELDNIEGIASFIAR